MSHLLRAAAALMLVWALLLLPFRATVLPAETVNPILHWLANGLALANVVLAVIFVRAAADPARHLMVIVAAMLVLTFKTMNDLYGLLALPPAQALAVLADLVLSVGLLVGILRELPRTIDPANGQN